MIEFAASLRKHQAHQDNGAALTIPDIRQFPAFAAYARSGTLRRQNAHMDNSVFECTAEDLVAHKLQRAGILVAKPRFDQQGADLLGLLKVKDGARFCRVQCKGRTVRTRAKVEVSASYVTTGFVLFLFVETGDTEVTHLYCFFAADFAQRWSKRRDKFVLSLKAATFEEELHAYVASSSRVALIKGIIQSTDVAKEFVYVSGIGMAIECDEALPLNPLQSRSVGLAEEHDEALPLHRADPPG